MAMPTRRGKNLGGKRRISSSYASSRAADVSGTRMPAMALSSSASTLFRVASGRRIARTAFCGAPVWSAAARVRKRERDADPCGRKRGSSRSFVKIAALRNSIALMTRGGSSLPNGSRSTGVRSMKTRIPDSAYSDAPAAGSRTGFPSAAANAELRSRNVCRPIGVKGSNTPCATFAEK